MMNVDSRPVQYDFDIEQSFLYSIGTGTYKANKRLDFIPTIQGLREILEIWEHNHPAPFLLSSQRIIAKYQSNYSI